MNKKQLIEAIADYPDDAPIVVSGGLSELIADGTLSGHTNKQHAVVWALSSNRDVINLEL